MGNVTIRVRDAEPADVAHLVDLIRGLADYERLSDDVVADEASLSEHLFGEHPFAEALIAEVEGRVVGYCLFFHTYSTFLTKPGIFVEDLFVLPACRGAGAGKSLLSRVAQLAVERGCGRLEWAVLDWNEPAIAFYRAIGAAAVEGWTSYRLAGEALLGFAEGR